MSDSAAPSELIANAGNNEYALSVLDPRFPAAIPDISDFTASVLKQVSLSRDLAVNGTGSLLLLFPEHDVEPRVTVLAWDSTTSTYNVLTVITFDEDLSNSFTKGRAVSALLSVKSATLTGTNFTVSGSVVAINYQAALPITHPREDTPTLSFGTLQAFARNAACRQGMTQVSEGVTTIMVPEGQGIYRTLGQETFQTINSIRAAGWTGDSHTLIEKYSVPSAANTGWVTGAVIAAGSSLNIFDSTNEASDNGPFMPTNAQGNIRFDANIALTTGSPGGAVTGTMTIYWWTADPTTYARVESSQVVSSVTQFTTATGSTTLSLSANVDVPGLVSRVVLRVSANTTNATVSNLFFDSYIRATFNTMGASWATSPGSAIAIEGMSTGQQLAISGIFNAQLVPNIKLAQNLPTQLSHISSADDLLVANHIFSSMDKLNLRFCYSNSEYVRARDLFPRFTERRAMRAMSSGLMDGLKGFWQNWAAPAIKRLAPIIGSAIGPEGTAIGSMVSGLIPEYSQDPEHSNMPPARQPMGYRGGQQQQQLRQRQRPQMGRRQYADYDQYDAGPYMGTQRGGDRQLVVARGAYGTGIHEAWEMSDVELGKTLVACLKGRTLPLHSIVLLMCVSRKTCRTHHDRFNEIMARVRSCETVSITTFHGIEVITPLEPSDPLTSFLEWAQKQTSFTKEAAQQFFASRDMAEVTLSTLVETNVLKLETVCKEECYSVAQPLEGGRSE